jgi:hypothetical protein
MGEQTGTFDSFECAIHLMAPACGHCGCRVLGHGVETDEGLYCCDNCAREAGGQHRERPHASSEIVSPPNSSGAA